MSMVPDVAAFLGDVDAADTLYALSLPYQRHYAEAPVEGVFGSVARGLGVLARTLRRFDAAEQHFEDALHPQAANACAALAPPPWDVHAPRAAALLAAAGPEVSAR